MQATGTITGRAKLTASVLTRYSFAPQFLRGGAIFARRAHEIEKEAGTSNSEELQSEHMACVVAAITQAAAALEAEIWEVLTHGPGHHLGSNCLDAKARDFLSPLADIIDRQSTVCRYDLVLHLLQKPRLKRDMWANAVLLIDLRNELIHYKSKWGEQMDEATAKRAKAKEVKQKLFLRLKARRFDKPAFVSPHTNFFPLQCLSASLASWSVTTGVELIDAFYKHLGITSPLKDYAPHLAVPEPIRLPSRRAK
jgi:hypothetical protein